MSVETLSRTASATRAGTTMDAGNRMMQARALTAKKNVPFSRQGIAAIPVLHERENDRDLIPPEDEVDKEHPDQEPSGKDRDNNGMVKEEDHRGDAKAETEVDELTDDLPHYRKRRHPVNKIPPVAGVFRNRCRHVPKRDPDIVAFEEPLRCVTER